MRKLIPKYLELVTKMKLNNESIDSIVTMMHNEKASLAMTYKIMDKLDYDLSEVESAIKKSKDWENYFITAENLFFDFVELDDDLIE
jgi:hypothetical protein